MNVSRAPAARQAPTREYAKNRGETRYRARLKRLMMTVVNGMNFNLP